MSKEKCFGEHSYFVADVSVVENEGKVCVIYLCTHCGDGGMQEFYVCKPKANALENIKSKE